LPAMRGWISGVTDFVVLAAFAVGCSRGSAAPAPSPSTQSTTTAPSPSAGPTDASLSDAQSDAPDDASFDAGLPSDHGDVYPWCYKTGSRCVVYVPTPQVVVDRMLTVAKLRPDDVLYDLGCGDGRILVTAAKRYGVHGVGFDIDPAASTRPSAT
jgi:hypothetical protein